MRQALKRKKREAAKMLELYYCLSIRKGTGDVWQEARRVQPVVRGHRIRLREAMM
jgi:hypothetical protein